MCVCGRVLHACGFGLCVQVCVCGTRLVSVRDASRVWSWCEYEDYEQVLHACGVRAVCASVCVWNALSECVMLLVCHPGVSMEILKNSPPSASHKTTKKSPQKHKIPGALPGRIFHIQ